MECVGNERLLAKMTQGNREFVVDGLLVYPNYALFGLMYSSGGNWIRKEGRRSSFLDRLKGGKEFNSEEMRVEAGKMREFLERIQSKLMILWLAGKRNRGRLTPSLWFSVVTYF